MFIVKTRLVLRTVGLISEASLHLCPFILFKSVRSVLTSGTTENKAFWSNLCHWLLCLTIEVKEMWYQGLKIQIRAWSRRCGQNNTSKTFLRVGIFLHKEESYFSGGEKGKRKGMRKLSWDLIALQNYLKEGCSEVGVSHFRRILVKRMWRNGL